MMFEVTECLSLSGEMMRCFAEVAYAYSQAPPTRAETMYSVCEVLYAATQVVLVAMVARRARAEVP